MSQAAVPPAPPPPIATRGQHGSRVRWGLLLGVFAAILVVILVVAGVALKLTAPKETEAKCPTFPCGAPPTPVPPPGSTAPALVAGTPYQSSGLGYELAYNPRFWTLEKHDANDVEFRIGGVVLLLLEGTPASGSSDQELADAKVDALKARVVSLTDVKKKDDRILGPAVGYRSGAVRYLKGTLDSPQGPGTPIDVIVMAASDDQASVVLTFVTTHEVQAQAFGALDDLMNTFRFPSEVPK